MSKQDSCCEVRGREKEIEEENERLEAGDKLGKMESERECKWGFTEKQIKEEWVKRMTSRQLTPPKCECDAVPNKFYFAWKGHICLQNSYKFQKGR